MCNFSENACQSSFPPHQIKIPTSVNPSLPIPPGPNHNSCYISHVGRKQTTLSVSPNHASSHPQVTLATASLCFIAVEGEWWRKVMKDCNILGCESYGITKMVYNCTEQNNTPLPIPHLHLHLQEPLLRVRDLVLGRLCVQPAEHQLRDMSTYAGGWLGLGKVTGACCVNWCINYWRNDVGNNSCYRPDFGFIVSDVVTYLSNI